MNSTLKFGTALFAKYNDKILGPMKLCPTHTIGEIAAATARRSAARPSRARTQAPKYSQLARMMERIIHDRYVAAMWSKDGRYIYMEHKHSTAPAIAYFYDGEDKKIYCNDNDHHALLVPYLYGLHPLNTAFSETRAATKEVADSLDATLIPDELLLAYLCDCFYYEGLQHLGASAADCEFKLEQLDAVKLAEVNQMVRTNNMMFVNDTGLDGYLNTTFELVSTPAITSSSSATASGTGSVIENIKSGQYIVGYDWAEEQLEKVRPLETLDHYIPNDTFVKMVKTTHKRLGRVLDREALGKTGIDAIGSDYINVMICGRPGTGKTTTVDALSAATGMPVYTVKVTKNTEEDTFEGMTKVGDDGKFTLHDTAFLEAYTKGGIVVLEEINLADPGVIQGAIGQAIEYPFILNRDGYQEVRRHPLCVIVATMNTGTQGAREPNQALTSRFPITLTMDDPNEADFIAILASRGHSEKMCKSVYKAYTSILNYLKTSANDEEMALCVTMRHCLAALDLVEDEIVSDLKAAVYDTMIGAIALRDMSLAELVYDSAVKPLALGK